MEESQRFQEKKDITHEFPSSISSPERPVDQVYDDWELLQQIFPQRSPLFPEDRIVGRRCGKPHLDIISSLLALGCTSICEKICSYMKLQDLYRFAQVSSIWRIFVQQHSQRSRWREYVRKCKETFLEREKENHGTPHYQSSTSYDNLPRFPLSQLNLNSCHRQGQDQPNKVPATPMPQICSSHSITPQIKNELRPCPKCTSPSTVSKSHNGHFQCRNQKCGLKFCPTCLRYTEQHAKSVMCYGIWTAQKSGKDIVGRKKLRDRLRRL